MARQSQQLVLALGNQWGLFAPEYYDACTLTATYNEFQFVMKQLRNAEAIVTRLDVNHAKAAYIIHAYIPRFS